MNNTPKEIEERAERERKITDEFLKDLDKLQEKHNIYFGISTPQFIIQPRQPKAPEGKIDIEGMPTDSLSDMLRKYEELLEKVPINVALIKAELDKRNKK